MTPIIPLSEETPDYFADQPVSNNKLTWLISLIVVALLTGIYLWVINLPPDNFPQNQPLIITEGTPARDIIFDLADKQYVKSSSWLYLVLSFSFGAENIKAGVYDIEESLTTFRLAKLITDSAPPSETVTLTFPEGFSVKEYAVIAKNKLTKFDTETFITLAKQHEGKLFPETYEVPIDYTEADLIELLLETYEVKLSSLRPQMTENKLSEEEIINLASIVEREANTVPSMRLVAGILDKRLVLGMPLQADATMEYVLDKPLQELTAEDLEIDTPYNTYMYKGLPPTPIGNPGIDSINAVLNPEPSPYLFYLTDETGEFHYAETYEEHQQNIARYLQ